jgi:pyruvate/2-oxoglutarate dehydrogenase complex dihydrolipoamide dehydrogenase (E3) component
VLEHLSREGIAIRSGVKVTRVGHSDGKIQAVIETSQGEETIEGSTLLIAAGRRANVDGLISTGRHQIRTGRHRGR